MWWNTYSTLKLLESYKRKTIKKEEVRKIGIAITSYNRYDQTINSFQQVLDDERIESVTIVDDYSTDDSCQRLVEYFKGNEKVRIQRNKVNEDCYRAKCIAVKNSESEWVCLWDSDNVFDKTYIDALYKIPIWDEQTFYLPEWARPHFSAKQWSGLTITKQNAAQYVDTHLSTNWNAMNFFINREEFLRVWDGSVNPYTSDSIYFSLCWLEAGNRIYITPNLQYDHYIDPEGKGHYQTNHLKTGNFHQVVLDRLKQLR